MRSGGYSSKTADAWLASLASAYATPSGSDDVTRMAAALARRSMAASRSAASYGENHYSEGEHGARSSIPAPGRAGYPSYGGPAEYGYGGMPIAHSRTYTPLGYAGRSASGSRRSSVSQTESLTQLIKSIAALQKAIEDNTGSYGGMSAGSRNPAQVTGDLLAGAAEGAKFGVFGWTASAVGAGVGGVLGAFGVKGQNRYIDAATGAASIYQTGAKQGVTVGNVIGGAAEGAQLGSAFGPAGTAIGAGVGGLLDIFGGLFGHHKPKIPEDETYDPSMFNSPSQFDMYAQLYNATGKYPNLPGQAFNQQAAMVQVQFYSDGVQQAVHSATTSATSRSAMTVASAYYDHTRPQ